MPIKTVKNYSKFVQHTNIEQLYEYFRNTFILNAQNDKTYARKTLKLKRFGLVRNVYPTKVPH